MNYFIIQSISQDPDREKSTKNNIHKQQKPQEFQEHTMEKTDTASAKAQHTKSENLTDRTLNTYSDQTRFRCAQLVHNTRSKNSSNTGNRTTITLNKSICM